MEYSDWDDDVPQSVMDSIKQFLETWPDAGFGPAHITLSDHNLGEGFLDDCINDICELLEQKAKPPDVLAEMKRDGTAANERPEGIPEMTWLVWLEHDRIELEDTKDFLEQVRRELYPSGD